MNVNAAAEVIENLLDAAGVHGVTVQGGNILPTAVRFLLEAPLGTRVEQVKRLESAIALALGVRSAVVDRDDIYITITVPRRDRSTLLASRMFAKFDLDRYRGKATAILGMNGRGDAVGVRFGDHVPHVLIGGSSGCGKSTLLATMAYTLARLNRPRDVSFVVVDTKGDLIRRALYLPNTLAVGNSARVLRWAVDVMRRRHAEHVRLPALIVFIDEMADVVDDAEALAAMQTLAAMGRGAGVHVVAATQYPTAKVMGGVAKANFAVRIVGRSSDDVASRVAAGAAVGAHRLQYSGEFILVSGGVGHYFVAAYTDMTALQTEFDYDGSALDMRETLVRPDVVEVAPADPVDVWAERFVSVWRAEGRYMKLAPTLRALGERPAGKRWEMWKEAHARARSVFFTSSPAESVENGAGGEMGVNNDGKR